MPLDEHAERDLEPLVAVARDDRDRVARPDAGCAETVDQLVDATVEFGPCPSGGVVGEGKVVAARGGEGCSQCGHFSSKR